MRHGGRIYQSALLSSVRVRVRVEIELAPTGSFVMEVIRSALPIFAWKANLPWLRRDWPPPPRSHAFLGWLWAGNGTKRLPCRCS
jgi:hypothetical protein